MNYFLQTLIIGTYCVYYLLVITIKDKLLMIGTLCLYIFMNL